MIHLACEGLICASILFAGYLLIRALRTCVAARRHRRAARPMILDSYLKQKYMSKYGRDPDGAGGE